MYLRVGMRIQYEGATLVMGKLSIGFRDYAMPKRFSIVFLKEGYVIFTVIHDHINLYTKKVPSSFEFN